MNGIDNFAKRLSGALEYILERLASPVRGLHLGIKHGTVTGALLLAIGIILSTWIYSDYRFALEQPAVVALARLRDAEAQKVEETLQSASRRSSFEALQVRTDLNGIEVDTFRIADAEEIVILWRVDYQTGMAPQLEQTRGTIRKRFDPATAPENRWTTIKISAAQFPIELWQPNQRIILSFMQTFPGSSHVAKAKAGHYATVPSLTGS